MNFTYTGFADEIAPALDDQIREMKRLGITHIEMRGVDGKNISEVTLDEARAIKAKLDASGMKISAVGSPIGKIGINDPFEPHLATFKRLLDVAHILGTKYMRIFSFYIPEGKNPEDYFEPVCERLSALIALAKASGIVLLHENERDIYGENAPRCHKLMTRLGCETLRMTFDPANFVLCGQKVMEAYELLYPHIEYIHVKDGKFDGSITPSGFGDGEMEQLMFALRASGFEGFLSLEPHLGDFVGFGGLQKHDLHFNMDMGPAARFELAYKSLDVIVQKVMAQPCIRLGIIGYGNIGSSHSLSITCGKTRGVHLTAICDINPAKLEAAKARYDHRIACFATAEDMLASGLVDSVAVCTPHYSHTDLAIKAFEAGMNVLVEKPICVYTSAARRINEAAAKSGKVFGIMYNQRTYPEYQKVREMVQNGEMGEIKRIIWIATNWYRSQSYYNSGGWRATWEGEGGGVLPNQDPHQLDMWQWIYKLPTRLVAYAYEGVCRDIEVENDVTAFAEYDNGASAVFVTATHETPGTNRLEISGTKGRLVLEGGKLTFTKNAIPEDEFNRTWTKGFGEPEHEVIEYTFEQPEVYQYSHPGIFTNFAAAVLTGEKLIAPGYEGINGLSISNAIHLSSWTGSWVELGKLNEAEYERILAEKIKNSKSSKSGTTDRILNTEGTY